MSGGRNRRNMPQGGPHLSPSVLPYYGSEAKTASSSNYSYPEPPSSQLPQDESPACDPSVDSELFTARSHTNDSCTDSRLHDTTESGDYTQELELDTGLTSELSFFEEEVARTYGPDTTLDTVDPRLSQAPSAVLGQARLPESKKRPRVAIVLEDGDQAPAKQARLTPGRRDGPRHSAPPSPSQAQLRSLQCFIEINGLRFPSPEELKGLVITTKLCREAVELWFRENVAPSEPEHLPADSAPHPIGSYPPDQQFSGVSEAPQASQDRVDIPVLDRIQRIEQYVRDVNGKKCGKRQDQPRGRYQCIYWCGFATDRRDDFKKHLQIKQPQKFWICTLCDEESRGSGNIFHLKDKIRPHIKSVHKKTAEDEINALIGASEVVCPRVSHPPCGFCRHESETWDSSISHLCAHFDGGVFQALPCGKADWHPGWPRHCLPPCPCRSCASAPQPAPDSDDLDGPDMPDDPDDPADSDPESNHRKIGPPPGQSSGWQSQGPQPGSASGSSGQGNKPSGFRGHCTARQSQHRCPVFDRSEAVESIRRLKLPFRHVNVLGTGGTAIVDKIEHVGTKLVFARKTVTSYDADHLRRVKYEIDIMKKLSHPNLVRFVAAYKEEQAVHIIMTPAADCSLRQYLRSPETWYHQKLPSRAWYGALASAVDYLHNTALAAHFDLKPENILLSSSHMHQVCISDFGSSKQLSALTSTFLKVNGVTPMYCCPEGKERRAVGSKADIWSLGCIFTELLTVELGLTVTGLHAHLGLTSRVKSWSNTYQSKVAEMRLWIMGLRRNCEPLAQGILDVCQSMLNYDASSRPTASELFRSISMVYLDGSTYPQQDVHGRSQYANIPALLRSWGSLRWQWQFNNIYHDSLGPLADTKQDLCMWDWSVRGYPNSCFSDCMQDETYQYDNVDMKAKLLESRSSVDLVGLGIWDQQALSAVPPTYHSCYEISIDTGCSSYLTSEQSLELRQLLGLEDPSDCYVLDTA